MKIGRAARWVAGAAFLSGLLALALSFIVFAQSSQQQSRPLQGGISETSPQQQSPSLQGGVSQTGQQQPTTDTFNSQTRDSFYRCVDAALCFGALMDDTQKAIVWAMSTGDPEWRKAESCARNPVWRNTDPSACWQYLTLARKLAEQNDSVKSYDLQQQAQAALNQARQCFDPIYRRFAELGGSYNDPNWNCGRGGAPSPTPGPQPTGARSSYSNPRRCKPPSQSQLNGYGVWDAWKYRVANAVAQHYYGSAGGAKKGLRGLLGDGNGSYAYVEFDIDENGKIGQFYGRDEVGRRTVREGQLRSAVESAIAQLTPAEILPFPARSTRVHLEIIREPYGCFSPGIHDQYVDPQQPTTGPTRLTGRIDYGSKDQPTTRPTLLTGRVEENVGGGDPFLVGLSDSFKECGEGYQQLILKVPVLLLSGNFSEAARTLGVRPGESVVLRTLTQELNQPVIGTRQTPYEAARRIGRRLCSYGISVGLEPIGAPRSGPRGRVPEPIPVEERPLPRRPSPTSFEGVMPDSVKQHVLAGPSRSWTPEEVGEAAMAAEAADRGYWSLLPPEKASGTPQGFDAIYWDPTSGTIVVAEAKGGYNGASLDAVLGSGYGARQGTIDWVEKAAQRITRAQRTNNMEVRYAEQILFRALSDRKVPLRVEVFHTDFRLGQPGLTRHYVSDSLP